MQTTENFGLKKPEKGEFYDVDVVNYNTDVIDTKLKEISDAANPETLKTHTENKENPHGVTKAQIGLGNVPNVATNDQTPTYTVPSEVAELSSGEKLSVAFGKIAKAVSSLISHLADSVKHITSAERTNWNAAYSAKHSHSNQTTLDSITAAYTTAEKTKLSGIAAGAQVNTITGIKGNAESSYRTGNVNLTPANIGAAASSHTHGAADVKAGTLGGKVLANATAVATLGDKQVRNIYAGTAELADGASLPSGDIYIQYE